MKQRAKVLIALSAFFVLSAFSLTPVSARPLPLQNLPGISINLLTGLPEITFHSYEATKIVHGYTTEELYGDKGWSEFTLEEKTEFLKTARFSLYIRQGVEDWESIGLSLFFWYDRDTDDMFSLGFRVFPKNTFDPGTYEFKGVWNIEVYGEPFSFENIKTVIVLP